MTTPNPTSFSKTPQAKDDAYSWSEDQLIASSQLRGEIVTFDVMANDLGGNAKSLFSLAGLSQSNSGASNALLSADTGSAWERTVAGNWARIENGRIEFKLGDSLSSIGAANLNALSASHVIQDEFVYAIRLGNGTLSQARVTINVQGQNDGPQAVNDIANAVEAGGVGNAAAGTHPGGNVLANDTDVDAGDSKTVLSVGSFTGAYGTLSLAADGSYTYVTNNADAAVQALNVGSAPLRETFSYTIADASGAQSTATLEVLVHGANDAAVLSADSVALVEGDTAVEIGAHGQLTVTDVDSDAVFVAQTNTAGKYGSLSIDAAGAWTYIAGSGHNEFVEGQIYEDSFTVSSADGTATTIAIAITGTNDAATITGAAGGEVKEDDVLTASGTLLVTDIDSPESFREQTDVVGEYGRFSIAADGKWVYTLDNASEKVQALDTEDTRTDAFTVTSHDGTASQVVTVHIAGLDDNRSPVAFDDLIITSASYQPNINVLANDSDPDVGNTLSIAEVAAASNLGAAITVNPNGTLRYNPTSAPALQSLRAGETTSDILTYSVKDNHGATSNTATVTVLVHGINDIATISGASTGAAGEDATLFSSGKLAVTDADRDESIFRTLSNVEGQYGKFSINSSGEWTYALNNDSLRVQALAKDQHATDSFEVRSLDGTASKVVTIDVVGANDAPVAVEDSVTGATITFEGGTYSMEYQYNNGYYNYNYILKTNDGYQFTTNNGSYVNLTSYYGADYSNTIYTYGSGGYYNATSTTTPIVMAKQDGSAFSMESANITGYSSNYYYYSGANLVETVTGYYQGAQVAQKAVSVPDAAYGARNNVVTLDGEGWQQVDKVVFSLTATYNNHYYDYYYGYYYNYAYQFIDNIVVNNTAGAALDIKAVNNDFDVDQGATLTVANFSATSAYGAAITLNANGSFHYDPTGSAELAALTEGNSVYDTFTYQVVDQYGALSNVAIVGINVAGVQEIA